MNSRDPELRLPLDDDLAAETVSALCDLLRDLADAAENRYAGRLIGHRWQVYERDARADARDTDHHSPHLLDEPPF